MAAERGMTVQDCGRTSQPLDPPIDLKDGDTVTVTLSYDLAQSIAVGAPDTARGDMAIAGDPRYFRDCQDVDAQTRVCMDFPDLVPSASR
jgi:hypothetical protein